jgi:hypothetical protein
MLELLFSAKICKKYDERIVRKSDDMDLRKKRKIKKRKTMGIIVELKKRGTRIKTIKSNKKVRMVMMTKYSKRKNLKKIKVMAKVTDKDQARITM